MKSFVVFAIFVACVNAALEVYPAEKAPKCVPADDGCWVSLLNRYVDGIYSPIDGSCAKWTCRSDKTTVKETCPTYGGNCTAVAGDPSAPYPGCCAGIKCEEGQVGYGVN